MKYFYVICAYLGEQAKAEPMYIAESFEEAKEKLVAHHGRYSPREICQVRKVTKDLEVIAIYWFDREILTGVEDMYAIFDNSEKRIIVKGILEYCKRWLESAAPEDREHYLLRNLNCEGN